MSQDEMSRTQHSRERGFWALIATQFLGAFNDNALQGLVVFLVLATLPMSQREWSLPVVTALFSVPFILFSMFSGCLVDRLSKRSVAIAVKCFEIGIMALVLYALVGHRLYVLTAAVFLMGTHSTFFAPAKYGLLPELLPHRRLSWGNGILEMGTMVAIIVGTAAAAPLAGFAREQPALTGAALVTLAVVGLVTSFGIDRVPPADPARVLRLNPFAELAQQWKLVRLDRVLFLAVLGNTYFWFLASILNMNVVILGKDVLAESDAHIAYLRGVLAIGIGLGSVTAGRLSAQKIEYGLIPLGSLGLTVASWLLAAPIMTFPIALIELAVLGFFAGFFVVPVNALIQHRPDETRKGGVIAFANWVSFVGIFVGSGCYYLATSVMHLTPHALFAASAVITLGATIYIIVLLPDSFVRLVLWLLTHTLYRIRTIGADNMPEKGGVLLACNHLSFVDALLLLASCERPVRFIIHKDIYRLVWVRPVARMLRCIPIAAQMRPRELLRALETAANAIREGEVVCIFGEGQISRIGQLLPFARGMERIMRGQDAPIVPVCLDGVWGSLFSFSRRRFFWKLPERPLEPVTVCYGPPLPATTPAFEVRQVVQQLMTDAWTRRSETFATLSTALLTTARHHPLRFAMADGRTPPLRFMTALARTIYLARRLATTWDGQEKVGILLPPSVAGALVNHAALLMGKVPVNLNYTASAEVLAACARRCGISNIVTSRAFLDRVHIDLPVPAVLIEDLAVTPRKSERVAALLLALFAPAWLLRRVFGMARRVRPGDVATIIFSSGSTGDPKGVMLSHANIASNVQQFAQTFALNRRDRVMGVLPFFHSFGFTATVALPARLGLGAIYHANPLDAQVIGELVERYTATFLLATPTFLQTYVKRCAPDELGSLEYVLAGAEKLPERIAQAFEDQFGLRPLEGYGLTECSPCVCVNTRDFRAPGFRQRGAKRGSIGLPLPGVSVRVVDPDTMQPLAVGAAGMLLVRGPNVMLGYLGDPEKTAEVMHDGWYVTGDIATIDEDGFVQITDRLSRFSKIGGEMVPHVKVEDTLHELAGSTERAFAVAGVPDQKRGERLIVLHTLADEALKPVLAQLPTSGLPNLWLPRAEDFHRVEAFPVLGTGKLDLRGVRARALELASA